MSIHAEINAHIAAGELYQVRPMAGDPTERTMIITKDIMQLLEGPWGTDSLERRANRLRADLESFVKGDPISVSMTPYEHKSAYLGLLDKPEHEVWDIRSRDPNPGLRVLGRFAETDVFVGLVWRPRSVNWGERNALGNGKSLEWEFAKLECEQEWDRLFPHHSAIHGADLGDYISTEAFLV